MFNRSFLRVRLPVIKGVDVVNYTNLGPGLVKPVLWFALGAVITLFLLVVFGG